MLTVVSAMSWPPAARSPRRFSTLAGEGRKSGLTRPAAVAAHQASPIATKTTAAIRTNSRVDRRVVRAKRRLAGRGRGRAAMRPPASLRGCIDEATVDELAEVDLLGEEARLLGSCADLGHDL